MSQTQPLPPTENFRLGSFAGSTTTSYQNWFIGAACNIDDMINAAEKQALTIILKLPCDTCHGIHAMADLYGEMPYSEPWEVIHPHMMTVRPF